jgi:hypothetical protein
VRAHGGWALEGMVAEEFNKSMLLFLRRLGSVEG